MNLDASQLDFAKFCLDVERTIASLSAVVAADDKDMSEEERQRIFTKLYLMTGLRAKGKEFDSAYIIHADRGVWPIKKAVELDRLEAERRLLRGSYPSPQKDGVCDKRRMRSYAIFGRNGFNQF